YTFFSSEETESHPRDTKTNGDWNMASAYAAWRAGDFFFTPQVNLGEGDFIIRRAIVAGTVSRQAGPNRSRRIAAGGVRAGCIFDVGGFQVMPQIALDSLYLRESSYKEAGAGGIGLSLKEQTEQSVRAFAGVLGQGTYTWEAGNIQPQILVGWTHEF